MDDVVKGESGTDFQIAPDGKWVVWVKTAPDDVKGERPMSAVMLRPGASASAEDVLAWARERIAPYKCPRRVFAPGGSPAPAGRSGPRRG